MIWKNIEFHNVEELEKDDVRSGLKLQRFPQMVRKNLERGRIAAMCSCGCEIRFVTDSYNVRISLSVQNADDDILIFRGNFFNSIHHVREGIVTTICIDVPERFDLVLPDCLKVGGFSPNVWRVFTGRNNAIFHEINTFDYELRPPVSSETPKIKWLAYGSSITQGVGATNVYNTYVQRVASKLGVDVFNLGLSGACFCEKEIADFFANRNDWDFATLEIGVNMRNLFDAQEFKKRAVYLIDRIISMHKDKTVVLITVFPNYANYLIDPDETSAKDISFSQVLRDIVKQKNHSNLHLIEGKDILTDFTTLNADLIHPSDAGHALMGDNLAKRLSEILPYILHSENERSFVYER